ncbi:MAG: hypothetical protein HYW26_02260 [Candidatus Aenigmarchaeota archaeon]|nr:hypothetical protein [Candidatus Aenigmarchaeota archaeon]
MAISVAEANHLNFLVEDLSPFRGEYLTQIYERHPQLLRAFDRYALKGGLEQFEALPVTSIYGAEDRPVYQEVTNALEEAAARGEPEKDQFLRRLRQTYLEAHRVVLEEGEKTHRAVRVLPIEYHHIVESRLDTLQGVSSCLRDLYKVMVDIVGQSVGLERTKRTPDIPLESYDDIPVDWLNDSSK